MILETHKIGSLYFVKNPYRRDLDKFCTTPVELQKILNDPFYWEGKALLSYIPVVYECHFWLAVPKFKKLSAAELKKLFGERSLAENPFKSLKATAQKPTNQKPLKKYKRCI